MSPSRQQTRQSSQDFYTDDLSAFRYSVLRDCLKANEMPSPVASFVAFYLRACRKLGFKLKSNYGFTIDRGQRIDRPCLPAKVLSKWAPFEEQFDDLGFKLVGYFRSTIIGDTDRYRADYLSADGKTTALSIWQVSPGIDPSGKTSVELNSYTESDPECMTSFYDKTMAVIGDSLMPDFVDADHVREPARIKELYELHQSRISTVSVLAMSQETVEAVTDRSNMRRFEFIRNRGIVRKLTEKEVVALRETS